MTRSGPWARRHLALLALAYAVAVGLAALGCYRVSGTTSMSAGISRLNLGAAGIAVALAANAVWIAGGRRALRRSQASLAGLWSEVPIGAPAVVADDDGRVLVAAGLTRYHRPDCPMVEGRAAQAEGRPGLDRRNLLPCEICQP